MKRHLTALIELPAWYLLVVLVGIVALTGLAVLCDVARENALDARDRARAETTAVVDAFKRECDVARNGSAVCPAGTITVFEVASRGSVR